LARFALCRYAHLESFTKPTDTCTGNPEVSYTTQRQEYVSCSYALQVVGKGKLKNLKISEYEVIKKEDESIALKLIRKVVNRFLKPLSIIDIYE